MVAASTLQPPSSTRLERSLSRVAHPPALDIAGESPRYIRTSPTPEFAPFIAAEFFLSSFAKYFSTANELIDAGLPWLRQRGTAAAVKRALLWVKIEGLLEEDGARLHIEPGTHNIFHLLPDIKNLVEKSIPAHVHFYRMYHQWDIRHARLDLSRYDQCLWDDDSGALIDGVKISFGQRITAVLPVAERIIKQSRIDSYAAMIRRDQAWWDSWVIDSEIQLDLFGGIGELLSVLVTPKLLGPVRYRITGDAKPNPVYVHRSRLPVLVSLSTHYAESMQERLYKRNWSGPWNGAWRIAIGYNISEE